MKKKVIVVMKKFMFSRVLSLSVAGIALMIVMMLANMGSAHAAVNAAGVRADSPYNLNGCRDKPNDSSIANCPPRQRGGPPVDCGSLNSTNFDCHELHNSQQTIKGCNTQRSNNDGSYPISCGPNSRPYNPGLDRRSSVDDPNNGDLTSLFDPETGELVSAYIPVDDTQQQLDASANIGTQTCDADTGPCNPDTQPNDVG